MTFFHMICCKICNYVCLNRPKITEKEAWVGPFLKDCLWAKSGAYVLVVVLDVVRVAHHELASQVRQGEEGRRCRLNLDETQSD